MEAKCIGYLPNGNVCGRPATQPERQAGGMLCEDCWQAKLRKTAVQAERGHRLWGVLTGTMPGMSPQQVKPSDFRLWAMALAAKSYECGAAVLELIAAVIEELKAEEAKEEDE